MAINRGWRRPSDCQVVVVILIALESTDDNAPLCTFASGELLLEA